MSTQDVSVWIAVRAHPFNDAIKRLANRLKTAAFHPHVTVLNSACHLSLDEIYSTCEKIASETHSFEAECTGLTFGTSYWMSVYLEAEPSSKFEAIQKRLKKYIYEDRGVEYNGQEPYKPHISLFYGSDLSDEVKKDILKDLDWKELSIKFNVDSIDVVRCPPEAISNWEILKSFELLNPQKH